MPGFKTSPLNTFCKREVDSREFDNPKTGADIISVKAKGEHDPISPLG